MQESIYPSSNRTAWKDTAEEQVLSIKEKFVIISNIATKDLMHIDMFMGLQQKNVQIPTPIQRTASF